MTGKIQFLFDVLCLCPILKKNAGTHFSGKEYVWFTITQQGGWVGFFMIHSFNKLEYLILKKLVKLKQRPQGGWTWLGF